MADDKAKLSTSTRCYVCGRPVPPKASRRGQPKIKHRECVTFEARWRQLADLIDVMRFMPPVKGKKVNQAIGHAGAVRTEIMDLWRFLNPKRVKTDTSDTEYLDQLVSYDEIEGVPAPDTSKPEPGICPVCGRPVPPKKGGARGRPKVKHRECVTYETRRRQLYELLDVLRFMPPVKAKGKVNKLIGPAGEWRKEFKETWRYFNPKRIKTDTSDTEYYDQLKRR